MPATTSTTQRPTPITAPRRTRPASRRGRRWSAPTRTRRCTIPTPSAPTSTHARPLALFQPRNEPSASGNTAKARDTPATFTGPDGTHYVIWAGSSKAAVGSGTPVAPSLYLTKVVASPGQPAFLQIVASNTQVMSLSGANIITANGTVNPIEWIVDAGVQRTDGLTSFANGAPTLYAYDALTLQPLWS